MTAQSTVVTPSQTYARLLEELHRLIADGKGETAQADAVRDEMDAPWYSMTHQEQERLGGLSEDFYALEDGELKRVAMSPDQRGQWERTLQQAFDMGSLDQALALLRGPPEDLPADTIWFLRSHCWERLGHLEVGVRFMREAERLDSDYSVFVMNLLHRLGRSGAA